MQINLGGVENLLSREFTANWLQTLLSEGPALAVIKRVSAHSIILQIGSKEVGWPLAKLTEKEKAMLVPKAVVELSFSHDYGYRLDVLSDEEVPETRIHGENVITRELSEVLVELDIPATEATLLIAKTLLEQGFSLKKEMLWDLLPWAERGLLNEALELLKADFPLRFEFLDILVNQSNAKVQEPLLKNVIRDLPLEVVELFTVPKWENRKNWAKHLGEGETFKVLARLLTEERLLEAVAQAGKDNSLNFVFALPFMLEDNLHAGWVRVYVKEDTDEAEHQNEKGIRLNLEIPTLSMGLVTVDLHILDNKVNITFSVERNKKAFPESSLAVFRDELSGSGWDLIDAGVAIKEDVEG